MNEKLERLVTRVLGVPVSATLSDQASHADAALRARHGCPASWRVLDPSAITDLTASHATYAHAVVQQSLARGGQLVVPAVALSVAATRLSEVRLAALGALLRLPNLRMADVTEPTGLLVLARQGLLEPPVSTVVAALVADSSHRAGIPVLTREPDVLMRVWPGVVLDVYSEDH